MDIEFKAINFNSICEGCLSVDRVLNVVSDVKLRDFFINIIEPLDHISNPLSLCWECLALVRKAVDYKKQARDANRLLVMYMLHQTTTLPTLSNLKKETNVEKTEILLEETENTYISQNKKKKHKNKMKNGLRVNEDIVDELKIEMKTNINDLYEVEAEPVFIKLEDNSDIDIGNDNEEYNVNYGDMDLKTPLKTSSDTSKIKCDTQFQFNESDDEPLMKVKEETRGGEKKPRERKKKKGEEGPKPTRACVLRRLAQLGLEPGTLDMVVLTWEQVEQERQNSLKSDTFTRHEYKCHDCIVGFNHRFKLENHMKKHDPSAGEFLCTVCRVRCPSQHAFSAHLRRHRVRWRCGRCGRDWSRAGVGADHVARAHGGHAPAHVCPRCGHTAATLSKLRNHLKNHAERQNCELCGKTFRDKATLKTHLFIHKGEKEHACPVCGKMFLFKKAMQIHAITHAAPEHLYCHQCDMNFKNQMSYYQHIKYNLKHVDPAKLKFACQLCDKKFMKASRLKEHNLAVHLKQTPIKCTYEECLFACSSRPVLRSHIRLVHKHKRGLRNYVCHTCGKAYTNKKTLEGHLLSHTGERPFTCPSCPATFRHHAALYNHNKLVHLKIKTTRRPTTITPWTEQSKITS